MVTVSLAHDITCSEHHTLCAKILNNKTFYVGFSQMLF